MPGRVVRAGSVRHEAARVVPGPIQAQRRQGIDVGVGSLDARRRRIDHFEGSNLAALEQLHGFACTQLD